MKKSSLKVAFCLVALCLQVVRLFQQPVDQTIGGDMTRTVVRMVMLAVVLVGVNVRPADASLGAFWDYLDHLSGPGPFNGVGIYVPIGCGQGILKDCWSSASDDDKVDGGVELVWAGGKDGGEQLAYSGAPPDIGAVSFGGNVRVWFSPYLGATVRVTSIHFTGDGVPARDTFVRFGPAFRFDLGNRFLVVLSPQLAVALGPFDREDLGALPGPELTDPFRFSFQGSVDLRRLLLGR